MDHQVGIIFTSPIHEWGEEFKGEMKMSGSQSSVSAGGEVCAAEPHGAGVCTGRVPRATVPWPAGISDSLSWNPRGQSCLDAAQMSLCWHLCWWRQGVAWVSSWGHQRRHGATMFWTVACWHVSARKRGVDIWHHHEEPSSCCSVRRKPWLQSLSFLVLSRGTVSLPIRKEAHVKFLAPGIRLVQPWLLLVFREQSNLCAFQINSNNEYLLRLKQWISF